MNIIVPQTTIESLKLYAERFENKDFIEGDPSWFMHQVKGSDNQEAMAFIAQAVSYGSRKQFMPKIQRLLDHSGGEVSKWVVEGAFNDLVPQENTCFYRLYTNEMFNAFLSTYRRMIGEYGSMGEFVRRNSHDTLSAIVALTSYFSAQGSKGIVPLNAKSSCKRLCMFLRWMVRDHSPVDLGLWSGFIDKKTLIMPLDVHVMRQSVGFGLLKATTATMTTALRLTDVMRQVFPDDPLKGAFALFGLGVTSLTSLTSDS